jgi:hypothetical protein
MTKPSAKPTKKRSAKASHPDAGAYRREYEERDDPKTVTGPRVVEDWHHSLCQVTGGLVFCITKRTLSRTSLGIWSATLRRIADEFDEVAKR